MRIGNRNQLVTSQVDPMGNVARCIFLALCHLFRNYSITLIYMKTAPFNLEKALAGHPLVTRGGRKVTNFRKSPGDPYYPYRADVGAVDESQFSFTEHGSFWKSGEEDKYDLFLLLSGATRDNKGRFVAKKDKVECACEPIKPAIVQTTAFPIFLPKGTVILWSAFIATTREDYLVENGDHQCIPVDHPQEWLAINSQFPLEIRSFPTGYTPPEYGWKPEVMDGKLWVTRMGDGVWIVPDGSECASSIDLSMWCDSVSADRASDSICHYRRPWPSPENQFVTNPASPVKSITEQPKALQAGVGTDISLHHCGQDAAVVKESSTIKPTPHGNEREILPLVIADLCRHSAEGVKAYGEPLRAGNGRSALRDAYENALDAVCYLRQAIEETTEGGK